ncbi:phosphoribosylaminoimidazolesuccinocarboxamide synthase, partial [Escherichia coli]|uniref:phosphoribosylaminoimidazolesuccinocarboxamide synthase n=1 Tax=Escherichia coli TaxID=562 RepID=UPI00203D90EF
MAFASPTPGAILALRLADHGGRLICQKDSFLAAAKGVSIGIHFQKRVLTGLFGGEGFIMQKLEAAGIPTQFDKLLSDTECLVKKLDMIPVECVVRNFAAGSL